MLLRTRVVLAGLVVSLLLAMPRLFSYYDALKVQPMSIQSAVSDAKPMAMKSSHVMDGKAKKKMNVLFMMMDGFRTEIGAYMHLIKEQPWLNINVKTPNLDKLATESLLFEQAFATYGRCSGSRSSMFVGRRPDALHVQDGWSWIRDGAGENLITLPQYFKANGYRSYGMGKSYCPTRVKDNDKLKSWDVMWRIGREPAKTSWEIYPTEKRKKTPLLDDILLDKVKNIIDDHSTNNTHPFFLFAGFKKPHMPLTVLQEYLDLYPIKEMKRAPNEYMPKNTPSINPGYHNNTELFFYDDMKMFQKSWKPNMTITDDAAIAFRRAYYACVSYIDDLIGEVMKKLEESGLKNNTIVLFAADHGLHLGENGLWGKDTSFEVSTRIPMMMNFPGVTKPKTRTRNFVEIVDIFPTLIEAAQLPPVPLCPEDANGWAFCTEGVSFLPILNGKNPQHWKNRVFWQGRWVYNHEVFKAYTVRTDEYRYTEYVPNTHGRPKEWPDTPKAIELYHKATDPGENNNLWRNESYAEVMKDLSKKLHAGWRSAMPAGILEEKS